jgi:pimeloyl-ACP methyl ester carboxylesterase
MIPFTDFGGAGQPLHFLHANGYPPGCYTPLAELLTERYRVLGMHLRPLWGSESPESVEDWRPFSADLIRFLGEQGLGAVVGIGHSIGGITTLRAAIQQPDLFRAIILIDPVLFPPEAILAWNLIRATGLGYRLHPLIPGALKRRVKFDDLGKLAAGYRRKAIFRYMSDTALQAYTSGITRPAAGGGFELAYPPEWEARIYYTGIWRDLDLWRDLKTLAVPAFILRGAETDTFLAYTAKRVQHANPRIQVETIEKSTHLLPLERPQEVFQRIQTFLASQLAD